jgi:nucleotide-binding universal stress UspA family protein
MPEPRAQAALERGIDELTFGAGPQDPEPAAKPFAFKRILLAVDGTPASHHAVSWAIEIAKAFGARVTVAHVVLPKAVFEDYARWTVGPAGGAAMYRRELLHGRELVDAAAAQLRSRGIQVEARVVAGYASPELLTLIKVQRADLVVLGSHGLGRFRRWILGSLADQIKNHAPVSVLIAKNAPRKDRILVAVDGSRASKRAAGIALRLAHRWRAHATVLHVLYPAVAGATRDGQRVLNRAFDGLGLPRTHPSLSWALDQGRPAARIVRKARDKQAPLIVIGSRGLSGLRSLIAGSVSNTVAHAAPTSVLLVKEIPK